MANLGNGNNSEPSGSAPVSGRWYNLTLGPSFKDSSSNKFCTLRYEFKPASIDKSQAGSLYKNKENRVTVEFQNNQPGKPKVTFEGSSEDYKENDGVLFFDGETFRLERLHRAVKRLRHVRIPGESTAASSFLASVTPAAAATAAVTGTENRSSPVGKMPKPQTFAKTVANLEVEKIDIGEPESPGAKPDSRASDHLSAPPKSSSLSPKRKISEHDDHFNLIFGDDYETPSQTNDGGQPAVVDNNINIDENNSDDEIADVDVSDDDEEKGPNAAEALRAQVNAEEQRETSSSSRTSGSGSRSSESESGSGTSSSDSEASDDDSGSSGGEVQI